ncbi:MAG: XamI family restriction endonuclease [Rhodomicrobium sp.]|nr:XamI family restriction endonuclease [Rhodomicrobium sp.]
MADPVNADLVARLVTGKAQRKAFRYLTAPPISEDDLKVLADTSLAPKTMRHDVQAAQRVRDIVMAVIDPFRFPWVKTGAQPTDQQKELAVIASAALAAAQEVQTARRNNSKNAQELKVKDALASIGFKEVGRRSIPILTAAPAPGEFCGESSVAGTRADVIACLRDGRVMAIECKVSNSRVNSYKRLVHDTGGKAAHWYREIGRAQVIPTAVLSGVFAVENMAMVQDGDLFLFWQHRLSDLTEFIQRI